MYDVLLDMSRVPAEHKAMANNSSSDCVCPQGRIAAWLKECVGVDPANLYPSVRCGLEGALLTALAQAHSLPLSHLLLPSAAAQSQPQVSESPQHDTPVLVNALLDCHGSVECCVAEACKLVQQGYTALKLKVSSHHSLLAAPLPDNSFTTTVH